MEPEHDTPWHSTEYVEPADRPAAWARMAADLHADGRTPADIADALCINLPTVQALLTGASR